MCGSESITSMGVALFDTVPPDLIGFGLGSSFNAKSVQSFLSLKEEEVSRIADMAPKSVRFDDAMPVSVRERLQEIANTINLVARFFGGDADKTGTWFKTRNPLLGDISPRDMIRLGRFERLRKFIWLAMSDQMSLRG
jgi:hypothetical protein